MKPSLLYAILACLLLFQSCIKPLDTIPSKKTLAKDTITEAVFGTEDQILKIICVQSGKALEIENNDLNDGAIAIQNPYLGDTTGLNNQKWKILSDSADYYKIVNLASGKYLGDHSAGVPGEVITQWSADGTEGQLWRVVKVDSISYKIINKQSGYAITNTASSTTNGNAASQQVYTDSLSQHWRLINITNGGGSSH